LEEAQITIYLKVTLTTQLALIKDESRSSIPFEVKFFDELKSKNIRDENKIDEYLRDKKIADGGHSNNFNFLSELFGNHIGRFNDYKTSFTEDYDKVFLQRKKQEQQTIRYGQTLNRNRKEKFAK
jgi:hypothetical protein